MKLNNYCILPFNSVSISATGEIRQCCNAGYHSTDTYIDSLDVNGIINNPFIQEVRDYFAEDKRHPKCDRCWKMEDLGSQSFRHISNRDKDHGIKFGIRRGLPNLSRDISFEDIEYIDITLGNKCNLACRMCNWSSSSLLAKQLQELGMHNGPIDLELSAESKDKVLELFKKSKNLNSIYMLGGEPLINPFHDEILDLLIESGQSKKIGIHYNTNLQVNKIDDYIDKWKQFKHIHLQASIDGCNEVYDYIRWPGNWQKVYKNLLRVAEESAKLDVITLSISTTIQNINALNIPKLVEICQTIHNKAVPFFFIPVVGKPTLDITPKNILQEAIDILEEMPHRDQIPVQDLLANYKKAVESSPKKQDVESFFKEQQMFDNKRKQNLFETVPYFIELAKEFDIERW